MFCQFTKILRVNFQIFDLTVSTAFAILTRNRFTHFQPDSPILLQSRMVYNLQMKSARSRNVPFKRTIFNHNLYLTIILTNYLHTFAIKVNADIE